MARWSIPLVCLVLGGVSGALVSRPMLHGQVALQAVPREMTTYREVVKKVLPAVVSIENKPTKVKVKAEAKPAPKSKSPFDDQTPIPEEFRHFFEDMQKRQFELPDEAPHGGFGSGFLVDPKGVILTNYHVVAGADQLVVELRDGRRFVTRDIKGDQKTDLAIVRIHTKESLPFLEMGDSDLMEIGDRVLAVGAPYGLKGTVTSGIISAKGRNDQQINMYEDFLQTDAAINPGNSGGPLVNLEGKVIGINAAIKSRSGGWQGVGLAIASNMAKTVLKSLVTDGMVHRGYLGIQMGDLTEDVASQLGLKDQAGVIVGLVLDNSPAAKAGLKSGDVITGIGGKTVKDRIQLQRAVASLALHQPVEVNVVREGKSQVMNVTIEEQPTNMGTALNRTRPRSLKSDHETVKVDKVGIEATDMTAELADQLGFKEGATGALLTKVERDGPAAEAGLARGLLVIQADKKAVKSAQELKDRVEKGSLEKGILLQVQSSRGVTAFVVLKAEKTEAAQ